MTHFLPDLINPASMVQSRITRALPGGPIKDIASAPTDLVAKESASIDPISRNLWGPDQKVAQGNLKTLLGG
ncbi:MAG TPA: hypothetical protein VGV37_02540 [Aliidongia sp.]|uniref:hypothetical protein n=1 Tax=Aliidongia sp. TaxID=1914230 RepID=UPI002DDCCC60|nr:hypothetical protein [Aliidongia sp.]HEV2673389.1 hypothetical protein [Aliidongia sp.]